MLKNRPKVIFTTAYSDSFVYFRAGRKMVKVMPDDILYIESMKDYSKGITKTETIITKQSISSVEAMLPEKKFIRIQRSFIVSPDKIKSFTSAEIIDIAAIKVPVGKLYRNAVMKVLGRRLNFYPIFICLRMTVTFAIRPRPIFI